MDNYRESHNRHTVYIERLATHLYNEHVVTGLDAAYKAARLILLDESGLNSLTQVNKLTAAIKSAINQDLADMWANVTDELNETAIYETSFYQKMFTETMAVDLALPVESSVLKSVANSLMTLASGNSVKSNVWTEFTKANKNSIVDTYASQVRAAFSNDESLNQAVKRLRNVNNNLLKRNAETLVRTGMNHYANTSREELMQSNKHLVPNKYYNAIFDNRTSDICRTNAGKVFAVDDKSAPSLPAHMNCRSNWLFLLEGQKTPYGTRSAVGGVPGEEAAEEFEKRDERTDKKVKYRGKKDTNIFKPGQISGKTSMDNWLISQPDYFIESSLGKGRAELFKAGKISLKDLTDLNGRSLTLAELKEKGV